jgi:hypothetical protein
VWCSYVRLELLEGVVAYHNGQSEKACRSLTFAQAKYLQVYSLIHRFYYFAHHCFSTISCCQSMWHLYFTECIWNYLQVPDEAISMLIEMGYGERSAKRAWKMTGYDIQSSVALLCEEREKKTRRREEDLRTQSEIKWASQQAVLPPSIFSLFFFCFSEVW